MFKISATKLNCYIACKKKYDFTYNEELQPIQKTEALEIGSNYHEAIANYLKNKELTMVEDIKIETMRSAFIKYISPQLDKIKDVEVYKEIQLDNEIQMIGYIDGITENGIPVEHKTTSKNVDEFYINRLNWDLQVAMYMILNKVNKCIYTVCQKPSIRIKKDETEAEFYDRCMQWYEDETDKKIGLFEVVRTNEELQEKQKEILEIAKEMKNTKLYYRNPNNCMILDCPYSSICLDYDKNVMPIGFKKRINDRKVGE